jgi:hypothetical protein
VTPSWRKPAGIGAILLIITIWAALIAHFAEQIATLPAIVQGIFYVVAGIVWIIPLKPLLKWMESTKS